MDSLINSLLTLVLIHGYPILLGIIFLSYLGLPIPVNLFLLASGAFTTDNTLHLYYLIPLVSLSAILGDGIHYYLGYRFGYLLFDKLFTKINLQSSQSNKLTIFLKRRGAWLIFVTRWLLTPLGIPVNFLAGINHYSFKSFIFWVILGEILWASIYTYLGHFFGTNWVSISEYINNAPYLFVSLFIGGICLYYGLKLFINQARKL